MSLDPGTLAAVACIMSAVIGALLLFSWYHDRKMEALGWWSLCCFVAATASLCYMYGGVITHSVGRQSGNGLFAFAFGLSYGAARVFNGKPMPWLIVLAAPVAWFTAFASIDMEFFGRLVTMSLIVGACGLLTAQELWSESSALTPSQRAAATVTAINAIYFLLRPFGGPGIRMPGGGHPVEAGSGWLSVTGIVIILYAMIFGFLIMAMAKEKADLEHRRAALVDPLTGVCNRRAFMQEAGKLLADAQRAHRPSAVIMFDLDHFKAVNDGHGHLVGDQTLVEFCTIAQAHAPLRSTLGRLGGEEFAIFVDGFDHASALEMAENIRHALMEAGAIVMGRPVAATVSAGVASSAFRDTTIADLLSGADAALYRAKEQGRNRVVAELYNVEPIKRGAGAMAAA